jgi:iron complex outermembrane receptor protein
LEPIVYASVSGLQTQYLELRKEYEKAPTPELEEKMKLIYDRLLELSKDVTVQKNYPARLIVNLGARYTIKNLEMTFDVHNLFNHKYSQSGMSTGLIPQKGLWFLGTIGYKF